MKFLNLFFFATVLLFTTSCDNEETCLQSDWVGTYTGTADCDGAVNDVEVTITANGSDEIIIEYVASYSSGTVTTTYPATIPTDCTYDLTESASGFTLTADASLNDDNLTINEVITSNSTNETFPCTITATRN